MELVSCYTSLGHELLVKIITFINFTGATIDADMSNKVYRVVRIYDLGKGEFLIGGFQESLLGEYQPSWVLGGAVSPWYKHWPVNETQLS